MVVVLEDMCKKEMLELSQIVLNMTQMIAILVAGIWAFKTFVLIEKEPTTPNVSCGIKGVAGGWLDKENSAVYNLNALWFLENRGNSRVWLESLTVELISVADSFPEKLDYKYIDTSLSTLLDDDDRAEIIGHISVDVSNRKLNTISPNGQFSRDIGIAFQNEKVGMRKFLKGHRLLFRVTAEVSSLTAKKEKFVSTTSLSYFK